MNTKDWTAGEHKLTAEYAGNNELGGSTTTEVTVTVNEVYAVYDGSKFCVATAESPKVPTATEITDKKTINHLYIMGESVPDKLMGEYDNLCLNLKTVTCADTVTTISDFAFANCTGLASVEMPSATTIGKEAFSDCSALASVEMPKVTSIGDSAFWGCTILASLTLGATPPTVVTDPFYGCSTSTLTIQGNTAYTTEVLADYKAAADGNITDNLWYG
ncbi:MAG: leucine-rich repeat domain-containing protein, partial [Oscillospiraceae bacterium]